MKHTEGEYTIQDDGDYGMLNKMHILAPDGELVAQIDILDQTDTDRAHKICDLLNAAHGITPDQAVKYLEHGKTLVSILKAWIEISEAIKPEMDISIFKELLTKLEAEPGTGGQR